MVQIDCGFSCSRLSERYYFEHGPLLRIGGLAGGGLLPAGTPTSLVDVDTD